MEEEVVVKHKATFLAALKGLEAARKYIHQFDTKNNITLFIYLPHIHRSLHMI
jgi:hypothetical protein